LPCDHEVMGSSLVEMQGKTAYIRPKVVGPFPGLCASRSYVHRAALLERNTANKAPAVVRCAARDRTQAVAVPSQWTLPLRCEPSHQLDLSFVAVLEA
jgi:hypothetical protein